MRLANCVKKCAIRSGGVARNSGMISTAAVSAASQSAQALTGYSSGDGRPVAGSSARKFPVAQAARHSPAIKTGWAGIRVSSKREVEP